MYKIDKTTAVSRFLKYVSFDTQSDENSETFPSSQKQFSLANYLADELRQIGLSDVEVDENCYVTATLPQNCDGELPTIGFIAHLDTSPDVSGKDVKASVVKFDGNDIGLNSEQNIALSPSEFPEMNSYLGQELIVTDGTTLLGADDKAGIAAIVSAMEALVKNSDVKHGKIRIAFTPDEEIGCGADRFDVKKFGADWAYTIDGGAIGELEYENFNAASATIKFKGTNVHPGYAKGKMVNANKLAAEFACKLSSLPSPGSTEGYEGFVHLTKIEGSVEEASLHYIIRDFDADKLEQFKQAISLELSAFSEEKNLDNDNFELEIKDQYRNMIEKIEPVMHIVNRAEKAMERCGIKPQKRPIRGGTDGARLSFEGLPCPNIFAGGHNFHSRYEFLPVDSLIAAAKVIVEIAKID
ncbi:MAG: peptidase T [Paludibacteraceae bacterium]|nr:peptidase T [Paludibacteraceae bacterium]